MLFFRRPVGKPDRRVTLPGFRLHPLFGKLSYEIQEPNLVVTFNILMPRIGEGWQTGVALDASYSMKFAYGKRLLGEVPKSAQRAYSRKGWLHREQKDGDRLLCFKPQAYEDAIAQGYLKWSENIIQAECCTFVQYLAERLDADGGTTLIYWACGSGDQIEVLGDIQATDCDQMVIAGPRTYDYGSSTKLLPALRYFVERFTEAPHGMYIFLTDGRLEDLPAVKRYCQTLAQQIQAKQRLPLKLVLIGIGDQIDQAQLTELDDLDTGTGLDLWDYKLAADMRQVSEIFAELVDESVRVAAVATLYDDQGQVVQRFTDGMPARVTFTLPQSSAFFELEFAGQERIRQLIRA